MAPSVRAPPVVVLAGIIFPLCSPRPVHSRPKSSSVPAMVRERETDPRNKDVDLAWQRFYWYIPCWAHRGTLRLHRPMTDQIRG